MENNKTYKKFMKLGLDGFKKLPATKQWALFEALPTPKEVLGYLGMQQKINEINAGRLNKYTTLYHRVLQYFETEPKATVLRGLARKYRDGRLTTKGNLEAVAEELLAAQNVYAGNCVAVGAV